ncbi:MAG: sulfate ABC transporter permease subunit CysT [Thermogutta sp.]|nr:sulfate ABC transporter permease subunit CysT [Thermogutta sp.]
MHSRSCNRGVLPGLGLSLGVTLAYLGVMLLLPWAALAGFLASGNRQAIVATLREPRVWAAVRLSFSTALIAALLTAVMGFLTAWVLVRYRFPFRRWLDGLIDLPFALPTSVSGIALTTLFAPNGWMGRLLEPMGIQVAYTPVGIVIALMFIGLPFVVRTLQPAIEDLDPAMEEAAACLGAGHWATFRRVVFPSLFPALVTGATLAFARGLGEYGSVIFIAGNLPMKTEIAPLLIVIKLEEYDYQGAATLAVLMSAMSLLVLWGINRFQARVEAYRYGEAAS